MVFSASCAMVFYSFERGSYYFKSTESLLIGLYHMGDSPDTKTVCPAFHVKHRTHT